MSTDPKDLPLEGTELQGNPSEPLPVLRVADALPPVSSPPLPAVTHSPLARQLAVLLRCHESAARHRLWQWIWWGIRALVVIGVTIPLCIGIGNAAFLYRYEPPTRHSRQYMSFNGTEYFIRGEPVSRAVYDEYQNSGAMNAHHAEVVGWAAGLGTAAGIVLLWTVFEVCWRRRYAPLEEQITAIQREHGSELTAWGSPSVLRDPGAVDEILQQALRR